MCTSTGAAAGVSGGSSIWNSGYAAGVKTNKNARINHREYYSDLFQTNVIEAYATRYVVATPFNFHYTCVASDFPFFSGGFKKGTYTFVLTISNPEIPEDAYSWDVGDSYWDAAGASGYFFLKWGINASGNFANVSSAINI